MNGKSRHCDATYNRRRNARYKVLRLLNVEPTEASKQSRGSARFRAKLEALGVDPRKHIDLCTDMRRTSHWERLRLEYGMPRYVRPVPIDRVVSRPHPPKFPSLGELSRPVAAILMGAGVIRMEEAS